MDSLNQNVDEFKEFYRERVLAVKEYKPHRGHEILAQWEMKGMIQSIITQNVDGFHQLAGSRQVAELHDTLQKLHCQNCRKEYSSEEYINQAYYCECGGVLRPSIILFGEMLPANAFQFALDESKKAELFYCFGIFFKCHTRKSIPLNRKG